MINETDRGERDREERRRREDQEALVPHPEDHPVLAQRITARIRAELGGLPEGFVWDTSAPVPPDGSRRLMRLVYDEDGFTVVDRIHYLTIQVANLS